MKSRLIDTILVSAEDEDYQSHMWLVIKDEKTNKSRNELASEFNEIIKLYGNENNQIEEYIYM